MDGGGGVEKSRMAGGVVALRLPARRARTTKMVYRDAPARGRYLGGKCETEMLHPLVMERGW